MPRQVSESSPAGSLPEPEPESKVEADKTPPPKRFCVWCGKQVPPKLVNAKFCVFCGGCHNGEADGAPNDGKPKMPVAVGKKPLSSSKVLGQQQAQVRNAFSLEEKARRQVAKALAEQRSTLQAMAWNQSQFGFGANFFGQEMASVMMASTQEADGVDEAVGVRDCSGLVDPALMQASYMGNFSSEAWFPGAMSAGAAFTGESPDEYGQDEADDVTAVWECSWRRSRISRTRQRQRLLIA